MSSAEIKTGLVGTNISHSLSPQMHQQWLKEHNLPWHYELFQVADDEEGKSKVLELMSDPCFRGCNITLPFKERVLTWLSESGIQVEVSPRVRFLGSANTLYKQEDSSIFPWALENTDVHGISATISNLLKSDKIFNTISSSKKEALVKLPKTCVILGNGGAARAVTLGLGTNPKFSRVCYLCRQSKPMPCFEKGVKVESWHFTHAHSLLETLQDNSILVINTLPHPSHSGTKTAIESSEDHALLFVSSAHSMISKTTSGSICYFDMSYFDNPTSEYCKQLNIRFVLGKLMLQEQGRKSFELWSGIDPKSDPLIARDL